MLLNYKPFVRSHLNYGDAIYSHPDNFSFTQKIKSIQYNSELAITDVIKCKLYQELVLYSLEMYCFYRKLCLLYTIIFYADFSNSFKSNPLKFTRPILNHIHNVHNPKSFQLMSKLRGIASLRNHKSSLITNKHNEKLINILGN